MSQCFLYDRCNHKDCDKPTCVRRWKLSYLCDKALLNDKQRAKQPLTTEKDLGAFRILASLEADMETFVNNSGKNNLLIYSNITGNGKSTWASRLTFAYLSAIWPTAELKPKALFVSVPAFLDAAKKNITSRDSYYNYIIDNVADADLVVWDDIATKNASDFDINKLEPLVEKRLLAGKANIYTTNIGPTMIASVIGARLASRIYNGSAYSIEFVSEDQRAKCF